jgi:hypothetical protein
MGKTTKIAFSEATLPEKALKIVFRALLAVVLLFSADLYFSQT